MSEDYAELALLLGRVRRAWRTVTLARSWALSAGGMSGVLALALVTQMLLVPTGAGLIALWGVTGFTLIACLIWMARPARRRASDSQVARFIEDRVPEIEDALVAAVSLRDRPVAGAMAADVVRDAVRRTRHLDPDRVVSRRSIRASGMRAAGATAILLALGAAAAGPAGRAAQVFGVAILPDRMDLTVAPGDVTVVAGRGLRIVATMRESVPGVLPVLRLRYDDEERDTPMEPSADGFAVALEGVDESFRYSVGVGRTSTRDYRVTVVRPPRVDRIDLRYDYPAGSGLAPRVEEDGGDIYGPVGTRVHLSVHTEAPVSQASLAMTGGERITLTSRGDVLEGEISIAGDGSYRVALSDATGLSNPGDTEYFIRALEDRPPDVRILRPTGDLQVTSLEEVTIAASADDDFGVSALDLVYSVRGGAERAVAFSGLGVRGSGSGTRGSRSGARTAETGSLGLSVTGRRTIYVEDLDVQPGDFVTYYARARDVGRGKPSSEARSDIYFLQVTPFEEEFVAVDAQGGVSGEEQAVMDLVESQKEVITATWRIDRRERESGARSPEDLRAVAGAQGELRRRAASAATQTRRAGDLSRRRAAGGRGEPAAVGAADSAMAKAAEAMGKAQEQLEALSTSGAMPHEMVALNELLRAQAEVRRREIQRQQQAGSGPTGNRQQQDLSSMFDRELAQEQRTNYETPPASDTPNSGAQESALDKVRDLGRRQEALNRELQELAQRREGMDGKELRRQLERLTREQSELRREAEELARRLEQGQQPPESGRAAGQGQAQTQGQSQQTGRAMQQASEEMQGAASELRRQNPRAAGERSSRALERLEDLERQLGRREPGERQRELGDLQLESRQLADAQRRLSSQPAGERGDSSDAARQRAGEQDRLASRMERLEDSVRQMAAEPPDPGTKSGAVSEAARELDRQKLAERMRGAARADREVAAQPQPDPQQAPGGRAEGPQPRDGRGAGDPTPGGTKPPDLAGERRAIAQELDRLAQRLAAARGDGDPSRELSEELSRIRELRERLSELDREITQEATGQGRGGREGGASALADAQTLVDELRREVGFNTPETSAFSPGQSAPGTEPWKQDFAQWEELKVQVAAALEQAESSTAARLRERQAKDRLNAGAAQTAPEPYRDLVDEYYRALASSPPEKR